MQQLRSCLPFRGQVAALGLNQLLVSCYPASCLRVPMNIQGLGTSQLHSGPKQTSPSVSLSSMLSLSS